ncbi:putative holin [Serratia liquefaciens]|uniref:putative holin n=1 Tax=Serratia liquefaciens TaxID=614 RepID=UPI003808B8AF
MFALARNYNDLGVIVASLCGAFVWVTTQRFFNLRRQPVLFLISFIMGLMGGDVTLDIVKAMVPGVFSDERSIGAFLCSALIITLIINITKRINMIGKYK